MKKTVIIIIISLTFMELSAQEFDRTEITVNAGGGVSGFQTRPAKGKSSQSWTTTLGAGFHFFFNPQWGIGTGANFAAYNDGITIADYATQQATTNRETDDALNFAVRVPNYREQHQALMATVPLMLQYQSTGKTIIYAAVGGKAGIPFLAKSRSRGRITTSGYYPNLHVTYDDLPEYGFVTGQPFPKDKSDIDLNIAFMASAEIGIKKLLVNRMNLYVGIFFDYGLNDMLNKQTAAAGNDNIVVFQPDTPARFAYNTALNSYSTQVKPFAIGVTARLAIAKRTWDKSYFKFRNENK